MIVGILAIGTIVGLLSGSAALLGGASLLVALAVYSGAGLLAVVILVVLGLFMTSQPHRHVTSTDPAASRQRSLKRSPT